jgi:hypothetical protein
MWNLIKASEKDRILNNNGIIRIKEANLLLLFQFSDWVKKGYIKHINSNILTWLMRVLKHYYSNILLYFKWNLE